MLDLTYIRLYARQPAEGRTHMSDRTSIASQVAELGTAVRARRHALGLSQEEVAELAETTQRFVPRHLPSSGSIAR